jgi:hypothetical protein
MPTVTLTTFQLPTPSTTAQSKNTLPYTEALPSQAHMGVACGCVRQLDPLTTAP